MRYRYRKYVSLFILLLIISTLYWLPFTFPFTFRSNALIYPAKVWNLRTDLDGNFFGEVKNFHTGVIETSNSYRFERGDITSLQVEEKISNNPVIHQGDTIGLLTSRFVEERIEILENQIAIDERLLESSKTGEKEEVIENLKQKVTLAEQQLDLATKNYERKKTLFDENVVPLEEFEIAESEYETAITNMNIARSDFMIAQTGIKPESLSVIEERIFRYKREMDFLMATKKEYLIISPLSGKLVVNQFFQTQGDYISIYDTSEYILYVPVKYRYRPYLDPKMRISFTIQSTDELAEAQIFTISDRVDQIFGHQVVFVKAKVVSANNSVFTGLSVQAKFYGEPITLREYIRRTIEIFI